MTERGVRRWLLALSAVSLLICALDANAAEVSMKSGDVLVGRINQDPLGIQVGRDTRTFPLSDLREWRSYRLTLTDGNTRTAARFGDATLGDPRNRCGWCRGYRDRLGSVTSGPSQGRRPAHKRTDWRYTELPRSMSQIGTPRYRVCSRLGATFAVSPRRAQRG